jgi:hypothetical protein
MDEFDDRAAGLLELRIGRAAKALFDVKIHELVGRLRGNGVQLKMIGAALGLSESQVSRIARSPEPAFPPMTVRDVVALGESGQIKHHVLVEWLTVWPYEPLNTPQEKSARWEGNRFSVVEEAHLRGILSEKELERIREHYECVRDDYRIFRTRRQQ